MLEYVILIKTRYRVGGFPFTLFTDSCTELQICGSRSPVFAQALSHSAAAGWAAAARRRRQGRLRRDRPSFTRRLGRATQPATVRAWNACPSPIARTALGTYQSRRGSS